MNIVDTIDSCSSKIIYISIGSANNQYQIYPTFLRDIPKNKVVLLCVDQIHEGDFVPPSEFPKTIMTDSLFPIYTDPPSLADVFTSNDKKYVYGFYDQFFKSIHKATEDRNCIVIIASFLKLYRNRDIYPFQKLGSNFIQRFDKQQYNKHKVALFDMTNYNVPTYLEQHLLLLHNPPYSHHYHIAFKNNKKNNTIVQYSPMSSEKDRHPTHDVLFHDDCINYIPIHTHPA